VHQAQAGQTPNITPALWQALREAIEATLARSRADMLRNLAELLRPPPAADDATAELTELQWDLALPLPLLEPLAAGDSGHMRVMVQTISGPHLKHGVVLLS
jgi:hypothetical protein